MFRGVLDEVDDILSELSGYQSVRIIEILLHGIFVDVHTSLIYYVFPLKISRFDGI